MLMMLMAISPVALSTLFLTFCSLHLLCNDYQHQHHQHYLIASH